MQVKVVIDGAGYPVEVPNHATVKALKEAVHDMFDFYAVNDIDLLFNGLVLQNNTKLETYQVVNDSEITIRIIHTLGIIGKNPHGKHQRYEVRVHRNNTVGDLKQKLHKDHGLDITNMRLQIRPQSYLEDRTLLWANEISSTTDIYIAEE